MADHPWPGIRTGAITVSVYNEALLVYLYDEANLPRLAASGADFESGYAVEDAQLDKALKKLAKDRILVAYELEQDDPLSIEVVVGPPLTKQELKRGRWQKPQTTAFDLVSGMLRIDSASTLPVHQEPEAESSRVKVPAGTYTLSLYRLDLQQLAADGLIADSEPWQGPLQILVLTPVDPQKPPKSGKAFLRCAADRWRGRYKIQDRIFNGQALVSRHAPELLFVNLDRKAAQQLGLSPGSGLRLAYQGAIIDAVFLGENDIVTIRLNWVRKISGDRPEFAGAFLQNQGESMLLKRIVQNMKLPGMDQWLPARITLLEERFPTEA